MKIKFLFALLIVSFSASAQFVTEWNTTASTSITVPTTGGGYNYTATIALLSTPNTIITTLNNVTGNAVFNNLEYNTDYVVKISGTFPRIYVNYGSERFKLRKVTQWGNGAWTNLNKAFYGCINMDITATDVPNFSGVTDMAQMFQFCAVLNGPANIGSWNTANVTDMSNLFNGATVFNQNINGWNTGLVTNMTNMFASASAFNQPIGNWDTGAVTGMSGMFTNAAAFNQDLPNWDTSSVTNMSYMFQGAAAFNGNISSWNTVLVNDMRSMFQGAAAFNQNIGSWNTGSVTNMESMFRDTAAFNQGLDWNTSMVTTMGSMFYNATAFNGDISNWDTGNVEVMAHMFRGAVSFNHDIGSWDVSSVWNMLSLFENATSFNQDISGWNVSAGFSMEAMFKDAAAFDQNLADWGDNLNPTAMLYSFFGGIFDNCGMSVANYDATLVGFSENGPNGLTMGALGMYYCNEGAAARANLVLPVASGGKGWTITGDTNLSVSTPILAPSNSNISLMATECNYNWANPANRARKMLTVTEEGNTFAPQSVVINNNSIGALPTGTTSTSNYYQKSSGANSIRVGNRMVSINDMATYNENDGLTVRVFYSAAEYTNILLTPPPTGEIVDAGWFLSQNNTAAGVVGSMSTNTYMLPGAEKIIPVNSGTENGYAFVEFKITKPGTIGLYAKTTEGSLSEVLGVDGFEKGSVALYPNPAKEILNIAFAEAGDIEMQNVSITNMLGQTVYTHSGNIDAVAVSGLSNGIYHISIATNKGVHTAKFIKE